MYSNSSAAVAFIARVAYVRPTYTAPTVPDRPTSISIATALGAPTNNVPVAIAVVGGTYTDDSDAHVKSAYVRESEPTVATIRAVYVAAAPRIATYRTDAPSSAAGTRGTIGVPARETVHVAASPGGSVPSSAVSNAASFPTVTCSGVIVVVPRVGHA